MSRNFQQALEQYAELTVKVGLNLQAGQRLLMRASLAYGVPFDVAPLVRQVAISAYKAGARFVDVFWGDDQLELIRFEHAPRVSFEEFPSWKASTPFEYTKHCDAVLTISSTDPDLLSGQDPVLVSTAQGTAWKQLKPFTDLAGRNATNWCVIAAAAPGWAAKVFPDLPTEKQAARLWDVIFELCRLDQPDPLAAWQAHIRDLAARSNYLNHKQYAALKYTAAGTDLTVGLPKGHVWRSAQFTTTHGIPYVANLPTEEVFTLPHKDKADGVVRAAMPLNYSGSLVENFTLRFAAGRVVEAAAEKGEAILRKLIETDEGAARLGEVALVPHSSPISQSGLLFYNTLLDENASSHLAIGNAYPFSLQGGETISAEEFAARGGNNSAIHVDFMIGSGEMDVDGITEDGAAEAVMRGGEWAFKV